MADTVTAYPTYIEVSTDEGTGTITAVAEPSSIVVSWDAITASTVTASPTDIVIVLTIEDGAYVPPTGFHARLGGASRVRASTGGNSRIRGYT